MGWNCDCLLFHVRSQWQSALHLQISSSPAVRKVTSTDEWRSTNDKHTKDCEISRYLHVGEMFSPKYCLIKGYSHKGDIPSFTAQHAQYVVTMSRLRVEPCRRPLAWDLFAIGGILFACLATLQILLGEIPAVALKSLPIQLSYGSMSFALNSPPQDAYFS